MYLSHPSWVYVYNNIPLYMYVSLLGEISRDPFSPLTPTVNDQPLNNIVPQVYAIL